MDEFVAQIRDSGSEIHLQVKKKGRLPPVEGVGWKDESVTLPLPQEVIEEEERPRRRDPMPGVVAMASDWQSLVGWVETPDPPAASKKTPSLPLGTPIEAAVASAQAVASPAPAFAAPSPMSPIQAARAADPAPPPLENTARAENTPEAEDSSADALNEGEFEWDMDGLEPSPSDSIIASAAHLGLDFDRRVTDDDALAFSRPFVAHRPTPDPSLTVGGFDFSSDGEDGLDLSIVESPSAELSIEDPEASDQYDEDDVGLSWERDSFASLETYEPEQEGGRSWESARIDAPPTHQPARDRGVESPSPAQARVSESRARVRELYRAGRQDEAFELLQNYIRYTPDDEQAHVLYRQWKSQREALDKARNEPFPPHLGSRLDPSRLSPQSAVPGVNLEAVARTDEQFTPQEGFILSRMDGDASAEEVLLMLPTLTLKDLHTLFEKLRHIGVDLERPFLLLQAWVSTRPHDDAARQMYQYWFRQWAGENVEGSPDLGPETPNRAPGGIDRGEAHKSAGRGSPWQNPRAIPWINLDTLSSTGEVLTPEEGYIVSRIDGHTSIEELKMLLPHQAAEHVPGVLRRLYQAGSLTFFGA